MSKIIFFDVDGTIWDDDRFIPESTKKAFEMLHKNGHLLIMCTGRARACVRSKELLDLGFDGIIAACGTYIEYGGKVIFEQLVEDEMVKHVIKVLRENTMPVVLEGSKDYWIDEKGFEEDPYVDYLFDYLKENAHVLRGYDRDIKINKFSADIIPNTNYENVKAELGKYYDMLEHVGNVVEFVPKGFSKATGIKWLCDHLGIEISETYAIGDSVNDLQMLDVVGHSIVMGNALDSVKDIAEYVTDDLHSDGLYIAMEHYKLI